MKFHWWDDAVWAARAYAQWTNLRHKVKGVLEDGLWLWVIEPGEPLEVDWSAAIAIAIEAEAEAMAAIEQP